MGILAKTGGKKLKTTPKSEIKNQVINNLKSKNIEPISPALKGEPLLQLCRYGSPFRAEVIGSKIRYSLIGDLRLSRLAGQAMIFDFRLKA